MNAKRLIFVVLFVMTFPAFAHTELYGFVNRALQWGNDGHSKHVWHVDNDSANSRMGLKNHTMLNDDVFVGGNLEYGVSTNSSNNVSQLSNDTALGLSLRASEAWLGSKCFGTLHIGYGGVATDDKAESTLSGTSNVAYSAVSDWAGGMLFHQKDSPSDVTSADPSVSNVFGNLDGGSQNRLMYTTPSFGGFAVNASLSNTTAGTSPRDSTALGAMFDREFNDFTVNAGLGWSKRSKSTDTRNQKVLLFSAAVLHNDTGLNGAVSRAKRKNAVDGNVTRKTGYYYVQLGKQSELNSWGKTNAVVDMWRGKHYLFDNDKSKEFGFGVEQGLSKVNSTLYFSVKRLKHDRPTQKYDKILAAFLGVKVNLGA